MSRRMLPPEIYGFGEAKFCTKWAYSAGRPKELRTKTKIGRYTFNSHVTHTACPGVKAACPASLC